MRNRAEDTREVRCAQRIAHRTAHVVRILSVPPVMVSILTLLLYTCRPTLFRGAVDVVVLLACLAVVPVLAYPIARLIPALKQGGRRLERRLAFILSGIGYAAGFVYGLASSCGRELKMIFTTYFLSVVLLSLCNKLLRFRASGHSCAVTSPILFSCLFLFDMSHPARTVALLAVASVVWGVILWASLYLKRHTLPQLLAGTAICALSLCVCWIIYFL